MCFCCRNCFGFAVNQFNGWFLTNLTQDQLYQIMWVALIDDRDPKEEFVLNVPTGRDNRQTSS